MQKYEIMLLVPANEHNENSAKEVITEFISELEKVWWKVFYNEFWGIRKLAYKVNWNTEGFYQVLNLELDPSVITRIETSLNINTNIVRYLFTKIGDNYTPFTFEELKLAEEERYKERLAKKAWLRNNNKRDNRWPKRDYKKDNQKKEREIDAKIEKIVEGK